MKFLFVCLTAILMCLALIVPAQKKNNKKNSQPEEIATFENYIKDAMKLWKTPGISIAVVKDNKLIYKNGFGVTELGKPAPFTTATLSICASTTKAMTAACMGMLVDEGKIKWSDKVSDVYPAFKLYDDYASSQTTIKDLFTHNTGLGNADWLWELGFPLDSIIYKLRLIKPAYSFRSSFIYQNLMYMVAGEVIHHVSGKPWDVFIKERLFQPLGMNHTYPTYSQSVQEPSHITPHFLFDSLVEPITYIEVKGVDAAGAVWSCADDINKWLLFLLDSAKVNGKALLTPETYHELFKPQAMVTKEQFYPTAMLTRPHWMTYGLGWFQEDYRGKMVNFHTGSLDGATAILGLIPEDHFGVYIFGNLDHAEMRHALMYKAMDLWCFHDNSRDWSTDMFKMYKEIKDKAQEEEHAEEAKRVLNSKPSLPIPQYCGKYYNEIYGEAEIVPVGDSLELKYPNDIHAHLSHWNFDTFLANFDHKWMGKTSILFSLDESGKVAQFTMGGLVYLKR